MRGIGRTSRIGLVLAYAVATVLAQAGDLHGHHAPAETHCRSACLDARPHLSGHASTDLGRAPTDCPACQLRSLAQVLDPAGSLRIEPVTLAEGAIDPIARPLAPPRRPSCRAPPRP